MITLLNRNSFTILAVLIMAVVWFVVGRSYGGPAAAAATVAIGVFLLLVSRRSAHEAHPVEAGTPTEAAAGKFTLIEYYSDY